MNRKYIPSIGVTWVFSRNCAFADHMTPAAPALHLIQHLATVMHWDTYVEWQALRTSGTTAKLRIAAFAAIVTFMLDLTKDDISRWGYVWLRARSGSTRSDEQTSTISSRKMTWSKKIFFCVIGLIREMHADRFCTYFGATSRLCSCAVMHRQAHWWPHSTQASEFTWIYQWPASALKLFLIMSACNKPETIWSYSQATIMRKQGFANIGYPHCLSSFRLSFTCPNESSYSSVPPGSFCAANFGGMHDPFRPLILHAYPPSVLEEQQWAYDAAQDKQLLACVGSKPDRIYGDSCCNFVSCQCSRGPILCYFLHHYIWAPSGQRPESSFCCTCCWIFFLCNRASYF